MIIGYDFGFNNAELKSDSVYSFVYSNKKAAMNIIS